jgi:hypothetical protein
MDPCTNQNVQYTAFYFFKTHLNIILPSEPRTVICRLSLRFFDCKPLGIFEFRGFHRDVIQNFGLSGCDVSLLCTFRETAFIYPSLRAIFSAHLLHFNVIFVIMFGEEFSHLLFVEMLAWSLALQHNDLISRAVGKVALAFGLSPVQ